MTTFRIRSAALPASRAPTPGSSPARHGPAAGPVADDRAAADPGASGLTRRPIDLALVAIVVLAAVLRLSRLGSQSFWLDEAFSVALARAPHVGFWFEIRTREANMSLYYALLRVWVGGGVGESFVRLLSAIAGIATVPVVYAIGARLFGRRTAIGAALLLAVDPMHVYASQDARSYALAVLLVVLSTWAFVQALARDVDGDGATAPGSKGRRAVGIAWWAVYALTSALAVYAHFYAGLVLLAQWLSLLARPLRPVWRPLLAAGVGIAVLLAPLGAFFLGGPHTNIDWLGDAVRTSLPRLLRAGFSAPGFIVATGYVSVLLGLVAAGWAAARSARLPRKRWAFVLVLAWLVVPTLIPLLVSITDRPVLEPRYLSVCLPALALMASAVIATSPAPWVRRLVFGVIVAGAAVADWALLTRYRKEDWRDATQLVLTEAQPGDALLFYAPYVRRPFDYYAGRAGKPLGTPRILYPSDQYSEFRFGGPVGMTLGRAVDSAEALKGGIWVVLSHTASDTTCTRMLDAALRGTHPVVTTRAFPAIEVRRYAPSPARDSQLPGPPSLDGAGAGYVASGEAVASRCPQR